MKKYPKSELEYLIEEWVIGRHSERNKDIIRDKLIRGMTIEEIAEKHDMSETRIKTVVRTFKRTLEAHDL